MKIIERTAYLEEVKELLLTPDIKVITGIRRSGKSKLLESLAAYVLKSDPLANVIHINFNLTEFEHLLEYHALEKYVESCFIDSKNNYLIIDEVQMCKSFEIRTMAINARLSKYPNTLYMTLLSECSTN